MGAIVNRCDVHSDPLSAEVDALRERGEAFAVATVIRTLGATAAKPGAKALLSADGTILQGWIGGGCVRGALARSVVSAIASGSPELVSLQPSDVLDEKGLSAGTVEDGVVIARNGCPSKGSMDIFVEPSLPLPELCVLGDSPVAQALSALAPQFQWRVSRCAVDQPITEPAAGGRRMVVVATQGLGDLDGLATALASQAEFVAFVGSRRKFQALREPLLENGLAAAAIDSVQAPAGVAIDAVTPDEIALSILAQLTQQRRRTLRDSDAAVSPGHETP